MTLCPVALAAGCAKCPVVKLCPLKEILGDYVKEDAAGGGEPAPEADSGEAGE